MDIKELRSFCMVAKLGSFSKASDALGLGQPAVTKHVQRLETEIGRSLLQRDLRPMRLTAAGSNLLRMAEPLVEGLETLTQRAPLAVAPPVAVGVPHGFVGNVLPPAIRELRRALPSARTRILSGTKEEVYELVQTGGVDFAVAPDPGPSRAFDFAPLFPSERILIVPQGHAFTRKPPKSLAEVAKHPLILPRFQTETRALLETEFRRQGVAYDIAVELDGAELIERHVALGVGLAVGLRGPADAEAWSGLAVVSLAAFLPSQTIGLVSGRTSPLSETAVALMGLLQKAQAAHQSG
jgi:LysR family transcriptional regulator, putative pyruvate carboxylase regulator